MTRNEAFPSKYLSKEDCNPPLIVTIDGASTETFDNDEGPKTKAILHFKNDVKSWIIPNCCWMEIEANYGVDSDDWIGKQIELFCDPSVMFGKKRVGGVRCRMPAAAAQPQRRAAAAPQSVPPRAQAASRTTGRPVPGKVATRPPPSVQEEPVYEEPGGVEFDDLPAQ